MRVPTFAEFDRRLFAPAPAARLAVLRMLVGTFTTVFLVVRAAYLLDISALPAARFEPVGALWFLGGPLPLDLVRVVLVVAVVVGVAATLGWRYRVTGPVFAVLFGLLTTYDNSWQHVAHTENLVAMHLLVIGVAPAAAVLSLDARRRGVISVADHVRFGFAVRLVSLLTVVTYFVAGVAKARHGGLEWVTGDVLRNQVAMDNVRKAVIGAPYSVIGGHLVRYGWLFPPMALATMVVELGAPLALLGGRVRTVWVAAAWGFHVAIVVVMAILFVYPLSGLAYASLLRPERLWYRFESWRERRRGPGEMAAASAAPR